MSKITLDNLSDNLKEYLNGLGLSEEQVLNLINENGLDEEELKAMLKDTMSINELNTNSKTVIGAINELFQSANNGKELIANAIGEPLSSEDTFSAMSNDINGLLSQFKTNMMKNGVTVESSDRFKSLIDKIKGLTEGEGNKGIQFDSGIVTSSTSKMTFTDDNNNVYDMYYFSLDYEPTILLIDTDFIQKMSTAITGEGSCSIIYNSLENKDTFIFSSSGTVSTESRFVTLNTNNNNGKLCFPIVEWDYNSNYKNSLSEGKYYAIRVGEEDTTLRDSLANILEEEGVNVTEEDDMASLISKVDEEFNRQVVPEGTAVASNVDKGKTFINSTGKVVTGTSTKVAPAGTAVASNVLSGKTFINSTGKTVTGTMDNRGGAQTITPGTSDKTLNSGYYSGNITVKGDSNLKASNIKSGVSIFGINGTLSSSLSSTTITKNQVSYKTGYVLVTHNLYVNMSVLFCQVGTYMQSPGTGVIYVTHSTGDAIISNLLNTSESTVFSASFYNDYYSAGDVCTVGLWISDITSTSFRINYKYEYDVSGEETDGLDITVGKIWYM